MKLPDSWLTQARTLHRVVQVNIHQIILHTLLLGLAFSVLLAIPFVLYQRAESANSQTLLQAEQERVIKLAAGAIHQEMENVLADLRYLSQNNEIRNYLAQPNDHTRRDLAREYLGLAMQKPIYDQVRFIGQDGKETVRVNFNDGKPGIVAERDLEDKHGRYYFQEARRLSPGQIYVSPLDLNVEHGVIELPHKPVIRFAAPVADEQGRVRGMVVLNYLGQRLRGKLGALEGKVGKIRLLNPEGYWLMAPTAADEWLFMFPRQTQRKLASFSPALWQQMEAQPAGVHQSTASWIRYERIYPLLGAETQPGAAYFPLPAGADRYYWTIVVELPQSAMRAANQAVLKKLWAVYGVLVLFAFLVSGALAFVVNRNRTLTQVVEKVIDDLPLLISYVDAEQRYRFNNMAYQRLFGLSPQEIYGKTMLELLGEAAYQAVRPYIEQALAGKPVSFERQLAYSGAGMHDVVVTYLPDMAPRGGVRGFYVMVNDISQVKDSERRDRQRRLELAHVSRLATMGEMATEIAHEINQPLAAIAMYSAAGLRTLQGEAERSQIMTWLEAINTQAKRASEIVRRVRRFVQKGEPQFVPVEMNLIAHEVADLLNHEAKSQQVEFVLDLAEDLPPVHGNPILLEQVLFNLTRNAMDAVLAQNGVRRVTLKTAFDARLVYVEVSDTGAGVDLVLGEHIFDSFVTSKQEGLGMGLTISRSIVEAHAGTLRYTENLGGGSTFMFSLARSDA